MERCSKITNIVRRMRRLSIYANRAVALEDTDPGTVLTGVPPERADRIDTISFGGGLLGDRRPEFAG
jgi:hypothetical protein